MATRMKIEMGPVRELWKELSAKSAIRVVQIDLEIGIEETEIVLKEITTRSLDAKEVALLASVMKREADVATVKINLLPGTKKVLDLLKEAVTENTTVIMKTEINVKRATLTEKEEITGTERESLVNLAVLIRNNLHRPNLKI